MLKNNNIKIKAVAIDLDGTLLNSAYEISEANKIALQDLKSAGIKVVLATGRRYGIGAHFAQQIMIHGPMIFQNGAVIKEVKSRETIYFKTMSTDVVRRVIGFALLQGYNPICFCSPQGRGGVLLEDKSEPFKPIERYLSASWNDVTVIKRIDQFYRSDITQIMFCGEVERMRTLALEFDRKISKDIKILITEYPKRDLSILDIMHKDVSKGNALKIVSRLWDIDMKHIAAIGDNFNDQDMLMVAGLPMVMGNADMKLKKKFPLVLPSNEQSGVAYGIWKYIIPDQFRFKQWSHRLHWPTGKEVELDG